MKPCVSHFFKILGLGFFSLALGYLLLLCFPYPLFAYQTTSHNLTLYCDDPIPPQADPILAEAQRRLEKCPLYAQFGQPPQQVFVCDHLWRLKLLTNYRHRVGGLTYTPLSENVFLRPAHIAADRLVNNRGEEVPADRDLSYYIAHEITHNLTQRAIGPVAYLRLPVWIREGYADYVGKSQFDFKKNLALFRQKDFRMQPAASGLYLRYHLLVAYLLDKKGVSVESLLTGSFDRAALEKQLETDPAL